MEVIAAFSLLLRAFYSHDRREPKHPHEVAEKLTPPANSHANKLQRSLSSSQFEPSIDWPYLGS